jgi:hypothetical protein
MFLDSGEYVPIDEKLGEKIIVTKVSKRIKSAQDVIFINVLYKDKVGWINQEHLEKL